MILIVLSEHVGQRKSPESAPVVGIDSSQLVQAFGKHASLMKQRSRTTAMTLRELEIDIAKPERVEWAFHHLIVRAARVTEVGVLMSPTAGFRQGAACHELHRTGLT